LTPEPDKPVKPDKLERPVSKKKKRCPDRDKEFLAFKVKVSRRWGANVMTATTGYSQFYQSSAFRSQ
jgi:hypothetical protein